MVLILILKNHPLYLKNLEFFQKNITKYPDVGLNKDQICDLCGGLGVNRPNFRNPFSRHH